MRKENLYFFSPEVQIEDQLEKGKIGLSSHLKTIKKSRKRCWICFFPVNFKKDCWKRKIKYKQGLKKQRRKKKESKAQKIQKEKEKKIR